MYNIDFSILLKDYKAILNGIYMTIFISIVSSLLAFIIGTFFVYYRISSKKIIHNATDFVVSCIRNTPLLILMYLFYKGLPEIGIVFSALTCGILALSFYTGAYISDALLSGINAVPEVHFQASNALGLSRWQSFLYVVYPQALRHSLYILGSQFMNLIKNSSLVSFIAVTDIFYVVYNGIADNYRIYEYFILAIVVYCSLTGFVLLLTNILSKIFSLPTAQVKYEF